MIAACLGLERFERGELSRFERLIRIPLGQTAAPCEVGCALFIGCLLNRSRAGWTVGFSGQLHNHAELASTLMIAGPRASDIYAAALDRWGDRADEHCVGHYAAVALSPDGHELRLARSPFQAPPLHFRSNGTAATVAQTPRVVFWREADRPAPDLERVAQTMVNDHSDRFRSWYEGAHRIPLGSAIRLRPDAWREVWRYDLFERPQLELPKPADYVEQAQALLDEGVAAALQGARKPAIMLSGGLDSPLVAASALRKIAPDGLLHSFTFGPEPSWIGGGPDGVMVDEFASVRAFAERHPRLVTTFESNLGQDFRSGQRALLEACDSAPSMLGLAWIEHALHQSAARQGCDVMLTGTWGNFTFSNRGLWAFSEYLLAGRWRQLAQALRQARFPQRPMWRRLASLSILPLLPRPAWQLLQRLRGVPDANLDATAINRNWPRLAESLQRSRLAGYDLQRLQFRNKRAHWRALLAEDGQEQDQYALGMELLHGLQRRDPTAYRPLVEFCWGCPTDVFLRDGTDRWLAREMARGQMPEAQRVERAYGHHYTDWQMRLAPIRDELLGELERMSDDDDIASVIDIPKLQGLVSAVPSEAQPYDPHSALPYQIALPVGMAAARFVAFAKGRNDI